MSNSEQMSARERIKSLLDDNSFVEIGALVTKRNTDFNLQEKVTPSDGVVTGYGTINGKLCYVYSQDVTVLSGSIGEMHAKKITNLYDLALKVGAPIIGFIDSAGLRLQETTDSLHGFGQIFLKQSFASGVIPQISVVFGTSGGGIAVSTVLSDFTIMTEKTSKLFVNSPNALEGNHIAKYDTSSSDFNSKTGVVDVVLKDEMSAIERVKELISFLPQNNKDDILYDESIDDCNRMLTVSQSDLTDTLSLLREMADNKTVFEIKANYAKDMVAAFIRLNGKTVGVLANREEVKDNHGKVIEKLSLELTTDGCLKAERFVKFLDAFHIPVLTITNVTGYKATIEEEKTIAIASGKLTLAFANATIPKINLIIGKAYGSAYVTMNSKHIGADLVFAYQNCEIGMMDAKMAAKVMYEDELNQVEDKVAFLTQKEEEYRTMQSSPIAAASRGYVDLIIEVASTRKQLIYAFDMLSTKRESRPSKKHGTI